MGIGKLSNGWKVNGTPIYAPSTKTKVLHTSISSADSGRTEDGVMHNTWVRSDMIKVSFVWNVLTGQEVKTLVDLMQGKEFTLTYTEFGEIHTADVYVAEINYTQEYTGGYAAAGGLCTGISANAIEI